MKRPSLSLAENSLLFSTLETLGSLFYPQHCAGCGIRMPGRLDLCPQCLDSIENIKSPRCEICSQPFDGVAAVLSCPNCKNEPFAFRSAVAVTRSRGVVRDLIHRLKYGRERWISRVLAGLMYRGLGDERLSGIEFDALVPVPLHPRRLREREFNQAELLARQLSRSTGIPVSEALIRRRYTGTQTRLDRKGRTQNLRDAFIPGKNIDVTDQTLLLVDDVLTTGSTLDACASALLEAGAASIYALTAARG